MPDRLRHDRRRRRRRTRRDRVRRRRLRRRRPLRFSGNAEVCDAADRDEDCNTETFGDTDFDLDGEVDAACCNVRADGARNCGRDCDDTRADVHPMQAELCDDRDNDCDGDVDEEVTVELWPDADGDSFGDASAAPTTRCPGSGWAANDRDCDDAAPERNPSSTEVCNGVDDDCDGLFDGPGEDDDLDGEPDDECLPVGARGDCNDDDPAIHTGATETCDGVDQDCDGQADWPLATVCVPCAGFSAPMGCGAPNQCCEVNLPFTMCRHPSVCTAGTTGGGAAVRCDGPEDCPSGELCCASGDRETVCSAACTGVRVCHEDADCEPGDACGTITAWFRSCAAP
ncbi:MAG: putative metal-binding motif-containing protein [Sandaracinaceae bacterium]|nr:putative metal-binding motif-containing protein [Sandaracinaceae bacterium]